MDSGEMKDFLLCWWTKFESLSVLPILHITLGNDVLFDVLTASNDALPESASMASGRATNLPQVLQVERARRSGT